jgi:trimethyllysine dioxygenase
VLHGRGAFRGRRKMAGAYLNREDFESCVRHHGLA